MNPNLNSALMYAHLNFKVFPLKVNSKSGQVLKSWLNEATTDEKTIQNWFSNTDYNVGVRTGNGFVVIDIDNKNDKKGIESIKPFLKGFPKTKVVKTPNNGWHMYYKVDRPIPNKTNLYEGIDVRGEHGYVVGIGSVIDGNLYFVSLDEPIAQANDAVYQFLEGTKTTSYLKSNVNNIIEQGTRNDRLFRLGCSLQNKGISDETIKMCLINENTLRCSPPLTEKEVNTIIQSIINRYDKPKEESVSEYHVTWKSALQMSQSPKVECTDIVENLLPIGVTLLAAPSKMGKTFLCMQMANAIAKGNEFLGFQCKQRKGYIGEQITFRVLDFFLQNKWIIIYLAVINFVSFAIFALDKFKALERRTRIRIVTLLSLCFFGGTIGGLLAMYLFRHKTKQDYFTVGLPLMLIMQVIVLFYIMNI